jgi:hypothetical protein
MTLPKLTKSLMAMSITNDKSPGLDNALMMNILDWAVVVGQLVQGIQMSSKEIAQVSYQ